MSGGKEHEILLESPDSLVSQFEGIRSALIDPSQSCIDRSNVHEFVCQFKDPDYYLCRCFATLYPYGRGCPSDKSCGMISNAKYAKHMLCLGGGPLARRFQQSAGFIFNMYTTEMRRKLGGVAYIAQKKNLDGSVTIDQPPTISDVRNMLDILQQSVSAGHDVGNVMRTEVAESTLNKYDEFEMQKMIRRLIPYSQSLQGTATHISYERAKLMAMIPSPIINNKGLWRLFFTVAPADLYESRFFEIVESLITDHNTAFWDERIEKVLTSFGLIIYVF